MPPSVPQHGAEQVKSGNNKLIIIGAVAAVVTLAVGTAALAWWKITTPQTEVKGTLPPALERKIAEQAQKAQIVCGQSEPLATDNMSFFQGVQNIVVNEWYVDPTNPEESFIELRNAGDTSINTDGINIILYPTDMNKPERNGGIVPTANLEPNCLMVLRQKDITPKEAGNFSGRQLYTDPTIVPTSLFLGNRSGDSNEGQIEYLKSMPAGYSVSLTSAGKYAAALKTPGAMNNATLAPAFKPSAATISYFKEVVPYIPRDNPDQRIIAKWTRSEVPVGVSSNASPEDRACVEKAVQEVRELTGLNMPGKSFDTKIGFRRAINIFFTPPSEFPEWAGQNTQAVARGTWHGGEFTNHIDEGEVYINPTLPPQEKCFLVYFGLGRALGVMRRGESHPGSMFHKALAPVPGYTAIDKEIIRTLYDRLIEPGDTLEDINRIIPG